MLGRNQFTKCIGLVVCLTFAQQACAGEDGHEIHRFEIHPLPVHQASFSDKGSEVLRWYFGSQYPRPFFYPFKGPASRKSLTRMGHPGAPDHDHHQSVWFAHHSVNGVDFWSNRSKATIRQKEWICYQDGNTECIMASRLGWYDVSGAELMEQKVIAALISINDAERGLEIQTEFRPPEHRKQVDLGKTNFGFLAVRVAKSISEYFGGGAITSSSGQRHEKNVFGKPAKWMDYSGPMVDTQEEKRIRITEGITFHDHPTNPRYPTHWHVREDGWMGASFCMRQAYTITHERPLVLRYLLHAHQGAYSQELSVKTHRQFSDSSPFRIFKSAKRHNQYEVTRGDAK